MIHIVSSMLGAHVLIHSGSELAWLNPNQLGLVCRMLEYGFQVRRFESVEAYLDATANSGSIAKMWYHAARKRSTMTCDNVIVPAAPLDMASLVQWRALWVHACLRMSVRARELVVVFFRAQLLTVAAERRRA
eukprot:6062659-Amphidinium_carterae.1